MKYFSVLLAVLSFLAPQYVSADPVKPWTLGNTNTEQLMGNGSQFIFFDHNNDLTPLEAMRYAREGKFTTVAIETPSLGYTETTTWI